MAVIRFDSAISFYVFVTVLILLTPAVSYKYDVFLSFRGEDTRYSFTDHLHKNLTDARIRTFRDDGGIRGGEYIPLAIKRAINESRIMIVVLSRDFGSSSWCLDELAMGMKLQTFGHTVLPVFYHLQTSDVVRTKEIYGENVVEHEKLFNQKVEEWKAATAKETAVLRRMDDDIIGEYDKLKAEMENHFMERVEGMKDLRRMVSPDVGEKIELYDENMAGIEKDFQKRMEEARNEIASLRKLVRSDIEEMIGQYDEVISEIKRNFKERIQGWKAALQDVVLLEGIVVEDGYETTFIGKIVKKIENKLNHTENQLNHTVSNVGWTITSLNTLFFLIKLIVCVILLFFLFCFIAGLIEYVTETRKKVL